LARRDGVATIAPCRWPRDLARLTDALNAAGRCLGTRQHPRRPVCSPDIVPSASVDASKSLVHRSYVRGACDRSNKHTFWPVSTGITRPGVDNAALPARRRFGFSRLHADATCSMIAGLRRCSPGFIGLTHPRSPPRRPIWPEAASTATPV
jgi:hypothetical protein